jgi:hypothetical protein
MLWTERYKGWEDKEEHVNSKWMTLRKRVDTGILRSWDRASLIYSSITNKIQRYTMVFITINALHVSGGSSAHHQELKTVYTALGICRAFSASYRYCEFQLTQDSGKKQKKLKKYPMLCIQF